MAEFTFTQRYATFVKRFIKLHEEDFAKDIDIKCEMENFVFENILKDNEYIFKERRLNNIIVSLNIDFEYDEHDKIDMDSLAPYVIVSIYHEEYNNTELYKHPFTICENEWVDKLIKTYQMCDCCPNELAVKEGYCDYCYPLVMEQEDACCICHENEGVWAKLECGHTMHSNCFKKINDYKKANGKTVKKCPLCRQEMAWNSYKHI